jgi:hypothetical protein
MPASWTGLDVVKTVSPIRVRETETTPSNRVQDDWAISVYIGNSIAKATIEGIRLTMSKAMPYDPNHTYWHLMRDLSYHVLHKNHYRRELYAKMHYLKMDLQRLGKLEQAGVVARAQEEIVNGYLHEMGACGKDIDEHLAESENRSLRKRKVAKPRR